MSSPPLFRWYHAVLLALIATGAYGLYHAGNRAWQRIATLQWSPRPPQLPDEPAPLPRPPDVSTLAATRDRPLFWPSRRPPPPPKAADPVAEPPRLLGVATAGDGRAVALLAFGTPPAAKVRRLAAGQAWEGYTVRSVNPQGVELEGPSGTLILTMPRRVQP